MRCHSEPFAQYAPSMQCDLLPHGVVSTVKTPRCLVLDLMFRATIVPLVPYAEDGVICLTANQNKLKTDRGTELQANQNHDVHVGGHFELRKM
jgi:hypothetical protein